MSLVQVHVKLHSGVVHKYYVNAPVHVDPELVFPSDELRMFVLGYVAAHEYDSPVKYYGFTFAAGAGTFVSADDPAIPKSLTFMQEV